MKIKSIKREKFKGLVYNFHCIPDENYFSENVLVHNCYKSNTPNGKYMSFESFKKLLDKFPHIVTKDGRKEWFLNQIAFGVDAHCKTNPDVWKIFEYCRDNRIIPNLTAAQLDEETAQNIAKYCGACAISRYDEKNVCYDAVDLLTRKYGMKQVNIHQIVAEFSEENIWETLKDIKTDERLKNLNAIVFLSLKQKGRGVVQQPLSQEKYAKIIQYCMDNDIRYGSDSCGAGKLLKSLTPEQYQQVISVVEPCEATKFSFYCDVDGMYYPCSFMANEDGDWKDGINMFEIKDFLKEVWNHSKTTTFREKVKKCNECLDGCCHFKV